MTPTSGLPAVPSSPPPPVVLTFRRRPSERRCTPPPPRPFPLGPEVLQPVMKEVFCSRRAPPERRRQEEDESLRLASNFVRLSLWLLSLFCFSLDHSIMHHNPSVYSSLLVPRSCSPLAPTTRSRSLIPSVILFGYASTRTVVDISSRFLLQLREMVEMHLQTCRF